jgi:hypothetical protein
MLVISGVPKVLEGICASGADQPYCIRPDRKAYEMFIQFYNIYIFTVVRM